MKKDAKRVLIAMSGGVDSSAAAALLREQGAQTLLTREGEIVCVSDGKTVSARQKN